MTVLNRLTGQQATSKKRRVPSIGANSKFLMGALLAILTVSFFILASSAVWAQSGFSFPDFSSVDNLNFVGVAAQQGNIIRLNPSSPNVKGGIWYVDKQPVDVSFETTFVFRVTDIRNGGADGIVFIVQNESANFLGGHTGYMGKPNNLAVEFDTWDNSPQWPDHGPNNVSVQSLGTEPNSINAAATLGATEVNINMSDGNLHTAKIVYSDGVLGVFLDDLGQPVLSVFVDIGSLLDLDNGKAWVGITAGSEASYENHDIFSWSFISSSEQEVAVDIKPGSDSNPVNLKSKGNIPVAILTTSDFDATTVDPLSVEFGPNNATESHDQGHIEDVDGDGDLDLMLHFNTQETGIQCGDTTAFLAGETFDGQVIVGIDSIETVGCK